MQVSLIEAQKRYWDDNTQYLDVLKKQKKEEGEVEREEEEEGDKKIPWKLSTCGLALPQLDIWL